MRRFSFLAIAIVIAVMVTAAACSSDGASTDENGRPSEPPPTQANDGPGGPETAVPSADPTVASDGRRARRGDVARVGVGVASINHSTAHGGVDDGTAIVVVVGGGRRHER